jgi:THAP4-like, heme-binding beta-barrel domain
MTHAPGPADQIGRLSRFIGTWRGPGRGRWGAARFDYVEELEFIHAGKPHLFYGQRTHASDDGRPLHAERGFWRLAGDAVELVIAQGIGVAETSLAAWDGDILRAHSTALLLTPTAKPVTAVQRTYEPHGEILLCTLEMSTDGGDVLPHLEARLERVR